MNLLNQNLTIKWWQAGVMIALTGFAVGTLLARAANVLGLQLA